jgi:hypothetical protein
MIRVIYSIFFITAITATSFAQTARTKAAPPKSPAAEVPIAKPAVDLGSVAGQTYTNPTFRFQIIFPDNWSIVDRDFVAKTRTKGIDLSLKAPKTIDLASQAKLNRDLRKTSVALTAVRSAADSKENAILRISFEDLKTVPQVKDAVDYFDLVRSQYAAMKLPPDFKYSETQAEQLGIKQFAFLDTQNTAGKKRMYATVRKGFAIMFTLSYTNDDDLQTFRQILSHGNFALK